VGFDGAGDEVVEVASGVDALEAAAFDEGEEDGGPGAGVFAAEEE
jgi:hypothetical protein